MRFSSVHAVAAGLAAILMMSLAAGPAASQPESVGVSGDEARVAPYDGHSGYQEIVIGPDAWYLAYHGTRNHTIGSVNAAWAARAAQLCQSLNRPFFIELRYVGEPVQHGDPLPIGQPTQGLERRVRSSVPIPIFIPSGPRPMPSLITPSKLGAVRCIERTERLVDGKRAVSVADFATPGAATQPVSTR